jgi:hypothetical protein
MRSNNSFIVIGFVVYSNLCVQFVEGWGKVGHEIIGNLAYGLLSEKARNAVDKLLDVESMERSETPMGSVASWADKMRYTTEFHWTTPLHYVDIHDKEMPKGCISPDECHFDFQRDCTNDMCAVAAISDLTSLFKNHLRGKSQLSKVTKAQALKFLIHFIGDIHQPLHVSRQSDKGGNDIKVSVPIKSDRLLHHDRDNTLLSQPNLHSVWDDLIIDFALSQQRVPIFHHNIQQRIILFQKSISDDILNPDFISKVTCKTAHEDIKCPSHWAQESLRLALTEAYVDEHGTQIKSGWELSLKYYNTRLLTIKKQIATSAVRLANTIEAIFGDPNNIYLEVKSENIALL